MPAMSPERAVLDATIMSRVVVRDFLLALSGFLIEPIWSREILYDAETRLIGRVLPIHTKSARESIQAVRSRFPDQQVTSARVSTTLSQHRVAFPAQRHSADAAATAVAGDAGLILTFELPPARFRRITLPHATNGHEVRFESVDAFLAGQYHSLPNTGKVSIFAAVEVVASSYFSSITDGYDRMRKLVTRMQRQGLRAFAAILRRELRSRTS
jgi:hypothetical protein